MMCTCEDFQAQPDALLKTAVKANDHRTFDKNEKRTCFFFFFLREHFKAKTVAVNLSAPPSAVWGQIHWFPVSQWTDILPGSERDDFFHSFCVFVRPLRNDSSVIVHCSWVDFGFFYVGKPLRGFQYSVFIRIKLQATLTRLFVVFKILSCHYPSPTTRMYACM